jgi:chemotaxis protein MotB
MSSKRQQRHEAEENAERWLLTYADMITLLMAFFIMLYSMSQLDLKKFEMMAGSVRAELGGSAILQGSRGVAKAASIAEGGGGVASALNYQIAVKMCDNVGRNLQDVTAQTGLKVFRKGSEVIVRLPASDVLFAPGNADLSPAMFGVLKRLASVLRKYRCGVKVEGHTCDLPIHNEHFASNWELSADRARNVALYFVRQGGVAADSISCMGFAHTRPLIANTSEVNRAHNRRVDIVLLPFNETAPPLPELTQPPAESQPEAPLPFGPARVNLIPALPNLAEEYRKQQGAHLTSSHTGAPLH